MLDAPSRLRVILASYKAKYPDESELQLLGRIDAELVPILTETIEYLPTTKETLNGYVEMIDLIDNRAAELGKPDLKNYERIQKGKAYLLKPETGIAEATKAPEGGRHPLKIMQDTRAEVWKQILA